MFWFCEHVVRSINQNSQKLYQFATRDSWVKSNYTEKYIPYI